MLPEENPYNPYQYAPQTRNWTKFILIFSGILIVIVMITVFFIIPHYLKGYLTNNFETNINNLTVNQPTYSCSFDLSSCMNFSTRAEAQKVYDYCRQAGLGNLSLLDPTGSGKACQSLP